MPSNSVATNTLTTSTAKLVRWLQEQVTLPWEPSVKFVQPLSVQFPSPSIRCGKYAFQLIDSIMSTESCDHLLTASKSQDTQITPDTLCES